jgi:hypothetical protein
MERIDHSAQIFKEAKMRVLLVTLVVLGLLAPQAALATTQVSEVIIIEGQKHSLSSLPLEQYYKAGRSRPQFRSPNTANRRGYLGIWEINQGRLYLKGIRAWIGKEEVGPEALFPGQKAPIPATWFTGKLRVPQGKVLRVGVPYPIHEKDLIITVEKGRVVRQEIVDNAGRVEPTKR